MASRQSSAARQRAEVRERLDALRDLAGEPDAQRTLAESYVRASKNMEILRPALDVLREAADPALRPLLHEAYARCASSPSRNDSGGVVRAAVVRALQPIVRYDDLPLLEQALDSYEMVGEYEVAAGLRTAALLALNDLEPALAACYAARFLRDPRTSNSGEPALTSIRLLAAQQEVPLLFGFAAWPGAPAEILAEALRNLVDLPASLVPLLVRQWGESTDEQVLLGLYDLLLAHPGRAGWYGVIERFLRHTRLLDLFGLVAMQIVVTRDEALIALLRDLESGERDPARLSLLRHALEHA